MLTLSEIKDLVDDGRPVYFLDEKYQVQYLKQKDEPHLSQDGYYIVHVDTHCPFAPLEYDKKLVSSTINFFKKEDEPLT